MLRIGIGIRGAAASVCIVLLGHGGSSGHAEDGAWRRALGSKATMTEKAAKLIAAYPDHLERFEGGVLVWKDGTRMLFDDGENNKSFDALLEKPDIEDQFTIPYPLDFSELPPPKDFDPGRFRNERFFVKMYGDCSKGEVTGKLANVPWLPKRGGGTLQVTTVNRIHERLKAVSDELDTLPDTFTKFLVPAAGGHACRTIAGTSNRSAHAYGAAIDINARHSDYWRWQGKDQFRYRNKIPAAIVRLFEKHGFIWGGKWYHYDTMHFEYRPELLGPTR